MKGLGLPGSPNPIDRRSDWLPNAFLLSMTKKI